MSEIICAKCQKELTPFGVILAWTEAECRRRSNDSLRFDCIEDFETAALGIAVRRRVEWGKGPTEYEEYAIATRVSHRSLDRLFLQDRWQAVLGKVFGVLENVVTAPPTLIKSLRREELSYIKYSMLVHHSDGSVSLDWDKSAV